MWETVVAFTVQGKPTPAARMTEGQLTAIKISGKRGEPVPFKAGAQMQRYLAYKNQVGWAARDARIIAGVDLIEDDSITLWIGIHTRRTLPGDLKNYYAGIEDAMQGVIYKNDKQVKRVYAEIIEGSPEDKVVIRVERRVYD